MKEALITSLIIIFVSIFVSIFAFTIDIKSCSVTSEKLGYKSEYSIWTGCILIDKNNNKFLLEQLRQIKN